MDDSTDRLENRAAKKFWQIYLRGGRHVITSGRLGTKGQTLEKFYPRPAAAETARTKLIEEKLQEGYVPVSGSTVAKVQARMKKATASKPLRAARNHSVDAAVLCVRADGVVFIKASPRTAGNPTNMDVSLVYEIRGGRASLLRTFPTEITGMATVGEVLYLVDGDCGMLMYRDATWESYACPKSMHRTRINTLRTSEGRLFGLTGDGTVFEWRGKTWKALVKKEQNLYLHDVAALGDKLYVVGERGFFAMLTASKLQPIKTSSKEDITCILRLGTELLLTARDGWLLGTPKNLKKVTSTKAPGTTAVLWDQRPLVTTHAHDAIFELKGGRLKALFKTEHNSLVSGAGQLWKTYAVPVPKHRSRHNIGVARFEKGKWKPVPLRIDDTELPAT